jgi:type VI secretion system protein ImpK
MEGFRAQVLNALQVAEEEARRAGYAGNDVRLAVYAVVALLDESVLASSNPVFREWARRPLQQEWFAGHVAGESFFNHVRELLMADDSHRTADLLEVHLLCLLLGYRGRFGSDRDADLRAIEDRIAEKIRRVRGYDPRLSPSGLPAAERVARTYDPWVRWATGMAVALLVVAIVLFVVYKTSLGSSISTLAANELSRARQQAVTELA